MLDLDFTNLGESVLKLAMRLIIVLISLTVHEVAHGWAALKLGDDTAERRGRLSLNPKFHLDPIGYICMLLFGFGWAKPVPINVSRFKKPKRDMAISALAGPVSNILLSFGSLLLYYIIFTVVMFSAEHITGSFAVNLVNVTLEFLIMFHSMNLMLSIFNFLPVPPLDGSRVLWSVLPEKIYFGVMKYERYISFGILICLWLGFLDYPLSWAARMLSTGMNRLLWLIPIFNPSYFTV